MENSGLERKPWKNRQQYETVLGEYLLEKINEAIDRGTISITAEQASELNPETSESFSRAIDATEVIRYIEEWIQRHRLPIDCARLIREGESNFDILRKAYEIEFKEED